MKLIRRLKKKKSTESQHSTAAPIGGASTSSTANDNFTKIDAIQNAGKLFEVLENVSEASDLLSPLKAVCGVLKIVTDMALVGNLLFSSDNTDKCIPCSFFTRMVKISKIWPISSNNRRSQLNKRSMNYQVRNSAS
jgi:hypothetical protein